MSGIFNHTLRSVAERGEKEGYGEFAMHLAALTCFACSKINLPQLRQIAQQQGRWGEKTYPKPPERKQ
jgi:hypothetical protein